MTPTTPDRGHVVWIDFSPHAGHEQGGRRPGVIVTKSRFTTATSFAVACPVTSQVKGYPFEVAIPPGLPVQGVILCDQFKSLDWSARSAVFICELPDEVMDEVLARIRPLFED
jgi:mRNA interferase MazF